MSDSSVQYEPANVRVSCVVALFLLSQVFLIISHAPLIQTLAWIILKTDKELFEKGADKLLEHYETKFSANEASNGLQDSCSSKGSCSSKENLVEDEFRNITDEEKQRIAALPSDATNYSDKPFLDTIYNGLDCTENDYIALFALSLLYALANNKGKQI